MAIEVQLASDDVLEEWDSWLKQSDGGTFFHQLDVLDVIAEHSGASLYHFVGYKGEHPIGIFPLFELSKGPVTTVFSPPPQLGIPSLGPVIFEKDQLKQHKQERRNRRFIDSVLEWVNEKINPSYIRITTHTEYQDPRPFAWNDFDVSPSHTYYVDTSVDEEMALDRFKKALRSDIRRSLDENYEVRFGDEEDIRFIIEKVKERYQAQGESYYLSPNYAVDLRQAAGKDSFPAYIGEIEGERVSGILSPRFNETLYYWQGGGKPNVSLPINDLIHWEIIRDAINSKHTIYDLTGANTPRLCEYKSKFNPELQTYYTMEKGTMIMNTVSDIYKKFR